MWFKHEIERLAVIAAAILVSGKLLSKTFNYQAPSAVAPPTVIGPWINPGGWLAKLFSRFMPSAEEFWFGFGGCFFFLCLNGFWSGAFVHKRMVDTFGFLPDDRVWSLCFGSAIMCAAISFILFLLFVVIAPRLQKPVAASRAEQRELIDRLKRNLQIPIKDRKD